MTDDDTYTFETKSKFDISVKQLEQLNDPILGSSLKLLFEGKDVNIKMINSVRRVSQYNIPTYAFPPEMIEIERNTCIAFNNDYMRLRLSNLPIFNVDPKIFYLHEKYWDKTRMSYEDKKREKHKNEQLIDLYINSQNNNNVITDVTTNDVKIFVDGNEVKLYNQKYPILLVKLKPNDTFKCHMRGALGVGERDVIWSASTNSYHEEVEDKKSYSLTLESGGQFDEYNILIKSCKYLLKKLELIKIDIQHKIDTKQIFKNQTIKLELFGEDHTIGEILNYEIQNNKDIIFSGVNKPNYFIKTIIITMYSSTETPLDAVFDSIDILINKYNYIGELITKLSNKKH
jgi:DNA-directed RNA polymerase subunit L